MRIGVPSLDMLSELRICVVLSCGVDYRCGFDLVCLWLWHRPLAWELPYAAPVALKIKNKQRKKTPSCNPAITLLGIYPNELETYIDTKVSVHNCPNWWQLKCPSKGEWINKLWSMDTMGYYSVIKKRKSTVMSQRDTEET